MTTGVHKPQSFTPLAALPAAVLDLETTGLNVTTDRIIQIGVVAMTGAHILEQPRINTLVNPGVPIAPASTRIHGLTDGDVTAAPSIKECIGQLNEALDNRAVVGHHTAYDLAVIRHEAARHGIPWRDPPCLDVALLAGALDPTLPDIALESLASWLGVQIEGRHSAIGDSLAVAEIFSRMLPLLRERDVRTFGEAQAFARRRTDLLDRQQQAGWNAVPGELPTAPVSEPITRVDSHIYARRVDEVMHSPPTTISPCASLREAARFMSSERVGSLLIVDENHVPVGILTERDALRIAGDASQDLDRRTVGETMTSPVESIAVGEMLYRALGRMAGKGIRHLCIVDTAGKAVGMVSQRDLVSHRASAADALGDAIGNANNVADMARVHGQLPVVAASLATDGLGGLEVARVVSNEVRALTARAAELTVARLETHGAGPAPAPWCVMVLGSAGRGESLLSADQDNALIHAGTDADDEWFALLGDGVETLLHEAGIPRCAGGVMASKPAWRGTREAWRDRVNRWLERAKPEDLLNVDIFFDMVPVAGERTLARELHQLAVEAAAGAPPFLSLLSESVAGMSRPLGMFGRLRTEQGRVDLKLGGLLPLVSMARLLALRSGSTVRSTPDRLEEAAARGRLSPLDAHRLVAIHSDLMTLTLKQQLADLDEGIPPSSRIAVESLNRDVLSDLKWDLRRLDEILSGLRSIVAA